MRRFFVISAILAVVGGGLVFLYWSSSQPSNLKNLIVLLEDPEGKVGELEIAAGGSRQVLSKSHQATGVSSAEEAPRAPFIVSDEEIEKIFGDVIKERPPLPVSVTLNFQPGVSILVSAGPQIEQIVAEVQRRPVYRLSIYGYASITGNAASNLGIALLRARSVGRALASRGLDPQNFDVHSLLDREGVAPTTTGAAVPGNRRVEVVIR
jgi:outer membrane protein OmpA-like peptidoglycan-associated protein